LPMADISKDEITGLYTLSFRHHHIERQVQLLAGKDECEDDIFLATSNYLTSDAKFEPVSDIGLFILIREGLSPQIGKNLVSLSMTEIKDHSPQAYLDFRQICKFYSQPKKETPKPKQGSIVHGKSRFVGML